MEFEPIRHGFFPEPKLSITFDGCSFRINDFGCSSVDSVSPGVYVWTVRDGDKIVPLYFGLYGLRAENPSLRKRFKQHLSGLRSSLHGNAPTKHWKEYMFPETIKAIEKHGKIDIYFGMYPEEIIDCLESYLIEAYSSPWNKAKA
ncbi:GIY-YIG nuclease family protein [Vibrio sp.]|uniref:GIY-YIG nuclease family protein n=1 Tax=Vibrio sp. TaxID=678 RepID=UPI00311E0BE6